MRKALSKIGSHLQANLVGYLALVIATSGTAYAVPRITTDDIGRHAVTRPKIAANAVDSHKIKQGEVRRGDIHDGAVRFRHLRLTERNLKHFRGPAGAAGPVGPPGPAGRGVAAFGRVNGDGTLVLDNSDGIDGVVQAQNPLQPQKLTGFYCFDLADGIVPRGVVVTGVYEFVPDTSKEFQGMVGAFSGCPTGYRDAMVAYHSHGVGSGVDRPFSVLFF